MKSIDQKMLKEFIHYAPETGIFTWIKERGGNFRVGNEAGNIMNTGYRKINFMGKSFLAHRLAWLYVYGEMPKGILDHKDRDRQNNRISNLRIATNKQNLFNQGVRTSSSTGFKGVWKDKGRFRAYVGLPDGKRKYLGMYDTPEEAHTVYMSAAKEIRGEFACVNGANANQK